MSLTAALEEITAALEAAGLRTALRAGDITPPVVYVRAGTGTEDGTPLTGTLLHTLYLYYIPVRGVDNLAGDAAAIDAICAAVAPLTWAPLTYTSSSVTVLNDTWPCYRFDVAVAGLAAPALSER